MILLALNAGYLHSQLNEAGDLAANSLSVREAKHFRQLYGQYSRWGFRHPGPGWFYLFAAGECLFRDWLHLVPTPINGQLIALLLVQSVFFATSLAICARWSRDWRLYLAVSLPLSLAHFACVGHEAFLSNWMPHVLALPFAAFVISCASVAAGGVGDLVLMIILGGVLLHGHVAQPLFVLPLWIVAYAYLWSAMRSDASVGRQKLARSHFIAAALLFAVALPVLIDASRGRESNLVAVVDHVRFHRGEHHSWGAALLYFLRIGNYRPSQGDTVFNRAADAHTIIRFVAHSRTTAAWVLAWVLAVAAMIAARPRSGFSRSRSNSDRFLRRLLVFCFATGILTVYWAHIQDGEMYYFNAWFAYGYYFDLCLIGAFAATELLTQLHVGKTFRTTATILSSLAAIAVIAVRHQRFRANEMMDPAARGLRHSVKAALASDGGDKGAARVLLFPHDGWASATAAAVHLERRSISPRVIQSWSVMFGERLASADPLSPAAGSPEPVVWRIVPAKLALDDVSQRMLVYDYGISLRAPTVDPNTGLRLSFAWPTPEHVSFTSYALYGWSEPDVNSTFSWSELPVGVMSFVAAQVPANSGVELDAEISPAFTPQAHAQQRIEISFNDTILGHWSFERDDTLRVIIPAGLWNSRGAAKESRLVWKFPDAVSPKSLHMSEDDRQIAFAFRKVSFGLVPSAK